MRGDTYTANRPRDSRREKAKQIKSVEQLNLQEKKIKYNGKMNRYPNDKKLKHRATENQMKVHVTRIKD